MCFVNSILAAGADARARLDEALTRVAEDSLFALVETPPDTWGDDCPPGTAWLEARVAFHGAGEGELACRLPEPLARDLASAFLGSADELPAQIVRDMAGELANMVCGCWLSRAYPAHLFQLEHPDVTSAEAPAGDWIVSWINGQPLALAVATRRAVS